MKKIFQIGLLLLLFIVTLAVVPQRSGPTHQDAIGEYVFVPDQPVPVQTMSLFDIQKDYQAYYLGAVRHGDVEKSPLRSFCLTCSQSELSPMVRLMSPGYMTLNRNLLRHNDRLDRQHRLDIGEIFPGVREMTRHDG
jgi:hypothetical protein